MTVNANAGEYKSRVGLKDLYIAEVLTDVAGTGATFGTPETFAPAAEASLAPTVNSETQYADDRPFDVAQAEGITELQLTVTNLPPEMLALVTGATFDAASGRVFDDADPTKASYYALGFRSLKSNGSYRYYWFLKGKFQKPSEDFATQGDSPDPKTPQITYTAIKTEYEYDLDGSNSAGIKRVLGDEDTTNFDATGWFSAVQEPSVSAPSAIALSSSVPTDGATGIAVGADITLTFNNPIQSGAIYGVTLLDDTPALVPLSATLSANRLVITLDPTSDLAASTVHQIVVSGVTDIYGQVLAQELVDFTTA